MAIAAQIANCILLHACSLTITATPSCANTNKNFA